MIFYDLIFTLKGAVAIFNHPGRAHYAGLLLQWPLAVAVVVSRESRDEKSFLVGFCPLENKDVK